ncbi:MAG: DUF2987 domain-containing protein [Pseudomonadota bacterium]
MKKIALLMLAVTASHAFAAEEREWAPYTKIVETIKIDKFHAQPLADRDKVVLYPIVKPQNKAIKSSDVVLTVIHSSGRQPMTVRPDGRVNFVYNPKWVAEKAGMVINQAKGEKMDVSFGLDAVLPEGTQWNYNTLVGSVGQANALIKKEAGMLSVFAPKIKSVDLVFAKPAQVKIGARTLATDAKNRIRFTPDEVLTKENPLMVASERPLEATLE